MKKELYPDFELLLRDSGLLSTLPSWQRKQRAAENVAGAWHSLIRGQGMEFDSVRAYVPGDEVRHIDWRVTARTGKPHLKLFHEERRRRHVLLVDDGPTMHFGTRVTFKNVQAARIAALLGGVALRDREAVEGMLFRPVGQKFLRSGYFSGSGRRGLLALLRVLSGHEVHEVHWRKQIGGQKELLQSVMTGLRRDRSSGSVITLISDFNFVPMEEDEEWKRLFARFIQHNQLLLVAVDDPADRDLPPAGWQALQEAGGARVRVNLSTPKLQTAWRALWEARRRTLLDMTKSLRIPLVTIQTNDDPAKVLVRQLAALEAA